MIQNGTLSTGHGPGLNLSSNTSIHPNYAALTTNGAVLQAAWPYFFKPGFVDTTRPYAEYFGEAFNAALTHGTNYDNLGASYDDYFGLGTLPTTWNGLFCSLNWVRYIAYAGVLPTPGSNYYWDLNGN